MNKNTKQKAYKLRKEIAALHRAGQKVTSPPSKRRSQWHGRRVPVGSRTPPVIF